MKKVVVPVMCLALTTNVFAQDAITTEWIMNTGGTAQFWAQQMGMPPSWTLIDLQEPDNVSEVCYNTDTVWVSASGLASISGPCLTPANPTNQNHVFRFPRVGQEETGMKTEAPNVSSIGVLVNGIPIYGKGDDTSYDPSTDDNAGSGQGIWNVDAWYSEGPTLDTMYAGHPQQQGAYHTHATPYKLYDDVPSNQHSPIVGFAFDGYPIYGPNGYDDPLDINSTVTRMVSGYEHRNITVRQELADGTVLPMNQWGPDVDTDFPVGMYNEDYEYTGVGHLDEYNGRFCYTPEYPDGTYAYFTTTTSDGEPWYPYFIGNEYYGVVDQPNLSPMSNITMPTSGTSCQGVISVEETQVVTIFNIYPNPTSDMVTIAYKGEPTRIVINNMMGQVVYENTNISATNALELSVSDWANGIYQVSVQYNDKTFIQKMIVAKAN